ncbi:MAG: hypothetical protein HQ495_16080 [Alphaproteobacteria bacterium]|nr:hypothetical protein [Alphaproteobacteria bacterium]
MNTTYLDNTPAAQTVRNRGGVVDHLAHTAAAIARASLRPVAAVVTWNRHKIVASRLGGLDTRLLRDIGVNHRDEVLFAGDRYGASPPAGRLGNANDNALLRAA